MRVTILTVIACGVIYTLAAAGDAARPAGLDLAALTAAGIGNRGAETGAATVQRIERVDTDGQVVLKPIETIIPGQFAYITFKGEQADWSGYDTLELHASCTASGNLDLMLYDQDKGRTEAWNIRVENLQPGEHTLSFVLAPAPVGALKLAGIPEDQQWNPDAEAGVQLMLVDYPRGFQIKALKLTSSTQEVQ